VPDQVVQAPYPSDRQNRLTARVMSHESVQSTALGVLVPTRAHFHDRYQILEDTGGMMTAIDMPRLLPATLRGLAIVGICCLAACGGGGGGGSSPPPPPPPPPPPTGATITAVYPNSVTAGSADTVAYVDGSSFVSGSVVNFNGSPRGTAYLSSTRLQLTLSSDDLAQAGSAALTVTSPGLPVSNAATVTIAPVNYTVRHIALASPSDFAWDSTNNVFYVLLANNQLAIVDPASGNVRTIASPGGPADHMALSDDNQYLYLYSVSSGGLQRAILPGVTLDISIPLPSEPQQVRVAPGAPHTVAVSLGADLSTQIELAIYDDATQRPTSVSGSIYDGATLQLAWGANASTLYGRDQSFRTFSVDSTGVTLTGSQLGPAPAAIAVGMSFDPSQGRVHLNNGDVLPAIVLDPVAVQWAGWFDAPGSATVDSITSKAFFVYSGTQNIATVGEFDLKTHRFLSAITYLEPGFNAQAPSLRWGTDGLAYLTPSGITLLNGTFISGQAPQATQVPTNQTAVGSQQLLIAPILANDIVWDATSKLIYAAVPGIDPVYGNSIVGIDPTTGQIVSSQAVMSDPQTLAVSADGQYLYVGLTGSGSFERLLLPALTPDVTRALGWVPLTGGALIALDLEVAPGFPHTIAVASGTVDPITPAVGGNITIYDDTLSRGNVSNLFGQAYNSIQWGADASSLYANDSEDTGYSFYDFSIDAGGVEQGVAYPNAFSPVFFSHIQYEPVTNRVYGSEGTVLDPATGARVGSFGDSGQVVADGALGNAWRTPDQLNISGVVGDLAIQSFDLKTFASVQSLTIPSVQGSVQRLIRWGTNGLAFNTDLGQVYILSGSFVN
jgi:hypothetical protein